MNFYVQLLLCNKLLWTITEKSSVSVIQYEGKILWIVVDLSNTAFKIINMITTKLE